MKRKLWCLCLAVAPDLSGARPDSAALLSPRPTLSPPCAPFQASSWTLALQALHSHTVGGGRDACCPQHLSWFLVKLHPSKRSLLCFRWVGRCPSYFSRLPIFLVWTLLLPLKVELGRIPGSLVCRLTKKKLHLDEGIKSPGNGWLEELETPWPIELQSREWCLGCK